VDAIRFYTKPRFKGADFAFSLHLAAAVHPLPLHHRELCFLKRGSSIDPRTVRLRIDTILQNQLQGCADFLLL
jgi:hypothetical protein